MGNHVLGLKIQWQALPVKAALVSGQGYVHGGGHVMFLREIPSFPLLSPRPGAGGGRLCSAEQELLASR